MTTAHDAIRATLAAYAHALDDGRTDDVVATFCPDGTIDIPGLGSYAGTEQLLAAYTQWKPRGPQRHMVVNTLVTDCNDEQATAVSDVVFLFKSDKGWRVTLVGRYTDTLHQHDGHWLFRARRAEFVE